VRRDLTLDVADSTAFQSVDALIRKVQPQFLEDVEYVTTYRGKQLAKGQKSVTLTLIFRSPATTLTSEQVESAVQSVIAAAQRELGATVRA
jgi:phenylalanyl-tRNA synthetase beta chain